MANETLTDVFSDIADAVRAKGVTGQMTPLQMPAKITSIPSGGGGDPRYDVDANGVLTKKSGFEVNYFNDVEQVGNSALKQAYQNSNVKSVSFPNLSSISIYGMEDCFRNCTELSSVSFPKL